MSLRKSLEKLKHDTRMKQINVKSGALTENDHQVEIKSLEDLADRAIPLNFERPKTNNPNEL